MSGSLRIRNALENILSLRWRDDAAQDMTMHMPPSPGLVGDSLVVNAVTGDTLDLDWKNVEPLPNPVVRTVAIVPQAHEYSSISAALASITDASASKPYLVLVTPGNYNEDGLSVPEYVSVEGLDTLTCFVHGGSSADVFTLQGHQELSKLSITTTHPQGSGFAAVRVSATNAVVLESLSVSGCSVAVHVDTSDTTLHNVDVRDVLDAGLHLTGAASVRAVAFTVQMSNLASPTALLVEGSAAHLDAQVCELFGEGTGKAVELLAGASANVSETLVASVATGISVPAQAGTPSLIASGFVFEASVPQQLTVAAAAATGHFTGYLERERTSIVDASPFFIVGTDSRTLTVAQKGADFASISDALAYVATITPAPSEARPVVIAVGPGTFSSGALSVPSFVTIQGQGQLATILATGDSDIVFLTLAQNSGVYSCSVICPGGAGTGIYYAGGPLIPAGATLQDLNITGTSFTSTLIKADTNVGTFTAALLAVTNVRLIGTFLRGVHLDNTLGLNVSLLAADLAWLNDLSTQLPATGVTAIYTSGSDNGAGANSVVISSKGIVINDSRGEAIEARAVGVHATSYANIGLEGGTLSQLKDSIVMDGTATQKIRLRGVLFANVNTAIATSELRVVNSNVVGSVRATIDPLFITLNPSATVSVNVIDPDSGDTSISGALSLGADFAKMTNATNAIDASTTIGVYSGAEVLPSPTALSFQIAAGSGYLVSAAGDLQFVEWPATLTAPALPDGTSYVSIDEALNIVVAPALASGGTLLVIARVHVIGGALIFWQQVARETKQFSNALNDQSVSIFGPMFATGCTVSAVAADQLRVDSGEYWFGGSMFEVPEQNPVTVTGFFSNGTLTTPASSSINVLDYDDGSPTLQPIGAGNYARHVMFAVNGGTAAQFLFVFATGVATTEPAAPIAIAPPYFADNIVALAVIIVKDGAIVGTEDLRPRPSFTQASGVAAPIDHQLLSNRGALNAHDQYLLRTGAGGMLGPLGMNAHAVAGITTLSDTTNPGQLIVPSAMAARLQPGGLDPLATAAPVSVGVANDEGKAAELARSDHTHAHGAQSDPAMHAVASAANAGFLSAADKSKLDAARASPPLAGALVQWGNGETLSATTVAVGANGAIVMQNGAASRSVTLRADPALAADLVFFWPPSAGGAGQFLQTSGGTPATLGWGTPTHQTSLFQVRTASGTNINTAGDTTIEWTVAPDFQDADYSWLGGNQTLQIETPGRYEVSVQLVTGSATRRTNCEIRLTRNTVDVSGGLGYSGYIRASDGNNFASGGFSIVIDAAFEDQLRVVSTREGNSGTVTMLSGQSVWMVKRL